MLEGSAFRRTEYAKEETKDFRHHVLQFDLDEIRKAAVSEFVEGLVQTCFPPSAGEMSLEMYRAYTNAVMMGDVAFVHRDSCGQATCDTCGPNDVTALLYPNPEWAPEFGGETVFYDEAGEIVEAVEPRCGRIVLFQGSIQHKGSPPNRIFVGARYTTTFKFSDRRKKDGS